MAATAIGYRERGKQAHKGWGWSDLDLFVSFCAGRFDGNSACCSAETLEQESFHQPLRNSSKLHLTDIMIRGFPSVVFKVALGPWDNGLSLMLKIGPFRSIS